MKVIINEKERGLLYKNGKLVKLLEPGKYHIGSNSSVEKILVNNYIENPACTLEALLALDGCTIFYFITYSVTASDH